MNLELAPLLHHVAFGTGTVRPLCPLPIVTAKMGIMILVKNDDMPIIGFS